MSEYLREVASALASMFRDFLRPEVMAAIAFVMIVMAAGFGTIYSISLLFP